MAAELALRGEALELAHRLQAAALPAGECLPERVGLPRELAAELLPDVTERGQLQRIRLVAHRCEGVELDVQVAHLPEGVLESADDAIGPAHPLAIAEEHQRGAEPPGGDPGVVDRLRAKTRSELPELPLDVGDPPGEESARRHCHRRGGLEASDGGGLGHWRTPP